MTPPDDLRALADKEYAPTGLERCCEDALVRRITETSHYVLNLIEVGAPTSQRVFYECEKCGRRLEVRA